MLYPAELRAAGGVGYRDLAGPARPGGLKAQRGLWGPGGGALIIRAMTDPSQAGEERADLEVKLSFLERTVDELNAVVVEQADLLDDLRTRLDKLERQARSGEGDQEPLRPHDDPPPHY